MPLEKSFPGVGRGTVDFLPSIYLSMALFASLGAGWIQDALQRNNHDIKPIFSVGGLCIGAGAIGSSCGTTFTQVLLGAVLTGIGIGFTGFTAAGICVQWFEKNRATMLLLAMAGSGCGNFCYTRVMPQLLAYFAEKEGCTSDSQYDAWRHAMRLAGIFSMVVAMIASTMMRLPLPGEVEKYENETISSVDEEEDEDEKEFLTQFHALYGPVEENAEQTGVAMGGKSKQYGMSRQEYGSVAETIPPPPTRAYRRVSELSTETLALYERRRSSMGKLMSTGGISYRKGRVSSIAELDALSMMPVNYGESLKSVATHITPATPTPGLPFLSLSEVIQTRTTLALLAWSTICSFAFTNVFVHVPAFAESVGLSAVDGARALSLTGLFMLLGNVTLGRVTDMIGPIRSLQITMCILMVLMFIWPYCTSPASLSALACLFGYCATTQSSVPLIILADAFRETSPDSILTLLGVLHVSKCPGYLFGPTIVGGLFDMFGNYIGGSIFTGTIMLVANLFLFTLPSTAEQTEIVLKKHGQVVTAAQD